VDRNPAAMPMLPSFPPPMPSAEVAAAANFSPLVCDPLEILHIPI
jgi:hypothetical protein